MKLHRTLVQAVIDTLYSIIIEHSYADKAVEHVLKQNSRWGSRDRRFIAETTYEMVRWRRLFEQSSEIEITETYTDLWKLFATWCVINSIELPKWNEFSLIEENKIKDNYEAAKQIRKYRESVPDWLDEIGSKELGEQVWTQELSELNKEAKVVLRVNTLKTSSKELKKKLQFKDIEAGMLPDSNPIWKNIFEDAFIVKRQNLHQLDEYKQGLFEIQDASSQLIAHFMELQSGMVVIDACAGAGGKSLHMASIIQNKGKIISMDIEERKLMELQKRAKRADATIIEACLINPSTISKLKNTADRLLLDVPCSGLGVLKRNPDAKWKLTPEFINEIKKTQQQIISNYSQMLKPGGIMVYATCSILPSENQQQVELFLKTQQGKFEFIEDLKIMPSDGFDGFYMAKIRGNR